jgi:cytochrome c553
VGWVALAGTLSPPLLVGAARGPDLEAGRRKGEVCAACHGPRGNSTHPSIPSLAGQPPLYTYLQLLQYREKRRTDREMSPYAANLSEADMRDLAAYYAAQEPVRRRGSADPRKIAAGKRAVDTHHCAACHAPGLVGQDHIPRLVGLPYRYVLKELRGFKAQRRVDIDGTMTTAAQPLSEEDIENLAHYIAHGESSR